MVVLSLLFFVHVCVCVCVCVCVGPIPQGTPPLHVSNSMRVIRYLCNFFIPMEFGFLLIMIIYLKRVELGRVVR